MERVRFARCTTGLGEVTILTRAGAITGLRLGGCPPPEGEEGENALIRRCLQQLEEYLSGERRAFDLPMKPAGTTFQTAVWRALERIPYGQTASYADVAAAVGCAGGARAVGSACRANPILILIPCHRVIGRDGRLTGYAGGMQVKRGLLTLEREAAASKTGKLFVNK